MKRNTNKEKQKRNKGFPYKKNHKKTWLKNEEPKWAIIDSKGKVIDSFRNKMVANSELARLKHNYYENLEIIRI